MAPALLKGGVGLRGFFRLSLAYRMTCLTSVQQLRLDHISILKYNIYDFSIFRLKITQL